MVNQGAGAGYLHQVVRKVKHACGRHGAFRHRYQTRHLQRVRYRVHRGTVLLAYLALAITQLVCLKGGFGVHFKLSGKIA